MLIDLRHLLRRFRRSPASAVAAVLTLTLTLGAGTSILAIVDAVLLAPPPFADPETLVTLGETLPAEPNAAPRAVAFETLEAWRERARSLAALEGYDDTNLTLTELGAPERLKVTDVTPGFLRLLGVTPTRGRTFETGDAGQPFALVSDAFWRTKLGADPAAIGRTIMLGARPHTIVGVLPEKIYFAPSAGDVWRPLPAPNAQANLRVSVIGRLAGNISPRDLAAALDEVSRRSTPPAQASVTEMSATLTRNAKRPLGLLAGAAAFAVLIAFANLAGLLLVRSIDRQRELAVRTALGAAPSNIRRQLVLEGEALVILGIAGGVLLALWLTPAVARLLEQFGGIANRPVDVSWRVIGIVSSIAAACGGLCGLLPAFAGSRRSVVDVLSHGVTQAPRELGLRRVFVIGEVAVTCVLLVSVALVGRSLQNVLDVDPGFDPRGVLALQVSIPAGTYPNDERRAAFYATLQRALEERLGPRTVSMVNELPLTNDGGRRLVRQQPADAGREAVLREVGPSYFDVMRIPLVAGRAFDTRDDSAAPVRLIVSESLAQAIFPGQQAIGRQIRVGPPRTPPAEIIGVVGDIKHRALDEEKSFPTVYLSAWQAPSRSMIVVARNSRPDSDVIAAVREEVARLDRDLPVYGVRTMPTVVATSPGVPARRMLTATFTGFALLAIVLSGIGLFGVVAHDVASRRPELALRLALGADPKQIFLRTLWQAALMVGLGLVAGGVLSIWATRALGSFAFATGTLDPLNVAIAAAVLLAVGVVAALPAARRAARTSPLSTLYRE